MGKNRKYISVNQVVGPIDRILRAAIGFLILLTAFILQLDMVEFAQACGLVIFFFITALTRWDPIYAIYFKFRDEYKDKAAINGRF